MCSLAQRNKTHELTVTLFDHGQIVVCTDGLSNVGLGQLDDINTEEKKRASERFYEQIGYAMGPIMGNYSLDTHTHVLTLLRDR